MKKSKKEEVLIRKRNARKIYIPVYLMSLILVIVLIYFKFSDVPVDALAVKLVTAFIIASLLATEIHRLGNRYVITQNSLVHIKGYFTKRARRLDFGAISDFYVIQNLWQRILSYGNIQVRLFSGESDVEIKNINRPMEFVKILEEKIKGIGRGYR